MKKIMLVGSVSCGKTTFSQALNDLTIRYKKTQSVEIMQNIIDTPGEYLENRNFYRALSVVSVEADIIILLQDCTDNRCMFAPSFSAMFNGKKVLGIITKIDLAKDETKIDDQEQKLKFAGAEKVFKVSSVTGTGIDEVREYLVE